MFRCDSLRFNLLCFSLSCYRAQASSNTFSVWWTLTLTVSIRSASPFVESRVSEDDSPLSLARSPRSTSTEEPVTSPRKRSTRSATFSPSLPVSDQSRVLKMECSLSALLCFRYRLRNSKVVLEQTEVHQRWLLVPNLLQHGRYQTQRRLGAYEEGPQAQRSPSLLAPQG